MKLHHLPVLAVAVLASACNSTTQMTTALKEDRPAAIGRCMKSVDREGPGVRSQFKQLTGASDRNLSAVVCNRLARGVESGRITWGDLNRMNRGQGTEIFKILKGR